MRSASSAAVGSGRVSAAFEDLAAFGGTLAGTFAVGGVQVFAGAVEAVAVDGWAVDDPAGAVIGEP